MQCLILQDRWGGSIKGLFVNKVKIRLQRSNVYCKDKLAYVGMQKGKYAQSFRIKKIILSLI